MSKLLAVLALLLCATTVTVAEAYNPVTLRGIWRALSLSREEDATPRAASPSNPPAVPSPAPSSPHLPVPPAASPAALAPSPTPALAMPLPPSPAPAPTAQPPASAPPEPACNSGSIILMHFAETMCSSSAPVTAEFCAGHTAVRPGLSVACASAAEHDYYLRCSQPSCSRRSRGDQRSARSCSILAPAAYSFSGFRSFGGRPHRQRDSATAAV
ncbi:hypothetical protein ABZP36_018887 [Zizania latifolia]